jgi:hypothetical protein
VPGVATKERETPIEYMAEACLFLVHGDAAKKTGIITYAQDVLRENNLTAAPLLA